jgi:hypothetical protein
MMTAFFYPIGVLLCLSVTLWLYRRLTRLLFLALSQQKRIEVLELETAQLVRNKANWVSLLLSVRRLEANAGLTQTELVVPIHPDRARHKRKNGLPVCAICQSCGGIITAAEILQRRIVHLPTCCPNCKGPLEDLREGSLECH